LVETFKRFVVTYSDPNFVGLSNDLKLLVGSLIWENLIPLSLEDSYIMEEQLVQFYFDLMNISKEEFTLCVLDSMEVSFTDN
jgi:hypothetical protein